MSRAGPPPGLATGGLGLRVMGRTPFLVRALQSGDIWRWRDWLGARLWTGARQRVLTGPANERTFEGNSAWGRPWNRFDHEGNTMARPWIGPARYLFIPLVVEAKSGYDPPPPDYETFIQDRVFFDPDPVTGDDQSIVSYFSSVSYGRAAVDATVGSPVRLTNLTTEMNPTSLAIEAHPEFGASMGTSWFTASSMGADGAAGSTSAATSRDVTGAAMT